MLEGPLAKYLWNWDIRFGLIASYYAYILVGESSAPAGSDPIAMMEYYMKKAAQEEKLRPPKHSKDEMPPPASLQGIIHMRKAISLPHPISPTYKKEKKKMPWKTTSKSAFWLSFV